MKEHTGISHQAAQWLIRMTDECSPPTDEDICEFERWKQADPRHRDAISSLSEMVDTLRDAPTNASKRALTEGSQDIADASWYALVKTLCVVAVLTLPLYIYFSTQITQVWLADKRTDNTQWQRWQLADNSTLHLSGNSAADIDFTDKNRIITLYQGELLIDVAPDYARPMSIETQQASFTALGTRYIVKIKDDVTMLTVLESQVQITSDEFDDVLTLQAGQQATVAKSGVGEVMQIDAVRIETNWLAGQYVIDGSPLPMVLKTLEHYYEGKFIYNSESLAELEVMAVLPLHDPERALTLLSESLPITVVQYTPWVTHIELAQD